MTLVSEQLVSEHPGLIFTSCQEIKGSVKAPFNMCLKRGSKKDTVSAVGPATSKDRNVSYGFISDPGLEDVGKTRFKPSTV